MKTQHIIRRAFEGLAYVTSHYRRIDPKTEDADDYVETMMVVDSLLERGGVDHRDLVARFRRGRPLKIGDDIVVQGGNRDARSQIAKLRRSEDPMYLAKDGITDGAAMKMLGPALYFTDWRELVYAANFIAAITHASPESRLAAVLVALRTHYAAKNAFRQLRSDLGILTRAFRAAADMLDLLKEAEPFLGFLEGNSDQLFEGLAEDIGFLHVATSTPVMAVMGSYGVPVSPTTTSFPTQANDFLHGKGPEKPHSIPGIKNGVTEDVMQRHAAFFGIRVAAQHNRAFVPRHDADTFYSMLIPIAILDGHVSEDILTHPLKHDLFERWDDIALKLAARWQ